MTVFKPSSRLLTKPVFPDLAAVRRIAAQEQGGFADRPRLYKPRLRGLSSNWRTVFKLPSPPRFPLVLALGMILAALTACSCRTQGGSSQPEVKAKGTYEAAGGYSK